MPEFPAREEITVEGYFAILDKYQSYFNENLVVVAHSIGNPMFIKYISKYGLKVGKYINLAGFSKDFFNEGKDVLNEKVKLTILNDKELNDINSVAIPMKDIEHIGKKSRLEELPEVIKLINS